MSNKKASLVRGKVFPFQDRIEVISHEIGLAVKWDRPSIIFAIFNSKSIRDDVNKVLKEKIKSLGQSVQYIHAAKEKFDWFGQLDKPEQFKNSVLIISGYTWECKTDGVGVLNEFNQHREFFIDNNLRAIFWLYEKEMPEFSTTASECWILRHRVIDFTDANEKNNQPQTTTAGEKESQIEACGKEQVKASKGCCSDAEQGVKPQKKIGSLDHARASLNLGLLFWRQGRLERALKYLRTAHSACHAIGDQVLIAQCLNALALVHTDLGNVEEAVGAYRSAIAIASEPGPLWNNLAKLLARMERNQEAVEAFKQAIAVNEKDFVSWDGVGHVFNKLGVYQNAIAAFENALKVSPDHEPALAGLGRACLETGELDKARENLQKALAINPHISQAWMDLARLNSLQKKEEDALSTYKQAVEANPESAELWEALAKTLLKKNDHTGSIAAFQKVVSLDPQNSKALVELAKSMFAVGDFESSASIFQEGIQSFDDPEASSDLWNRLGDAYLQMKDYDNALVAYQKSNDLHMGSGTQDGTGKPLAGKIIINNGEDEIKDQSSSATVMNPPQAIDDQLDNHIERGSDMNETSAVYDLVTAEEWNRHGNQHLKAGAYNDAITAYTKAIELSPNACWPYIQNLAYVHYQKGKDRGRQIGTSEEDPDIWEAEETMDARTSHAIPAISIIDEAIVGRGNKEETPKASTSAQMAEPANEMSENPTCDKPCLVKSSDSVPGEKKVAGKMKVEKSPAIEEKTKETDSTGNISPQNSIDWNELGDSFTASRKLDQAVEAYKKAIEMNSRFGTPYFNLGVVYYQQGKYDLATLLLKKSVDLLEKVDDRCAAWNKLGDAFRRKGDYGNALAAYQQGSELTTVSNPARMNQRVAILESNLAG